MNTSLKYFTLLFFLVFYTSINAQTPKTDRAARYITGTVGNIFYLIAATTSLLLFAGWNSLKDLRRKTEEIVEVRLDKITQKYNSEMQVLQDTLTQQSKKILENQNMILLLK